MASTLIYSVAGIDFLANYGLPYYPLGLVFTNVHACIIAYAIIQYRLLDVSVVIKRSLIYALVLIALLVPCYIIVIGGQLYSFGSISYWFSSVTLVLLLGVGFLFPKFDSKPRMRLNECCLKAVDYRETFCDRVKIWFRSSISKHYRIIWFKRSENAGHRESFATSQQRFDARYHLEAYVGLDLSSLRPCVLARERDRWSNCFNLAREPIVKEELEWVPVGPETPQTIETMSKLGAEISLPIISKETSSLAFSISATKKTKLFTPMKTSNFLRCSTNQAAIAIENARLYENLKQSQDTLRRADRLSSLGLLTAGLAHEIRNPLVAIRTFTQLLPERYDDAEFREGFQGLALKEVDRICGLINDLLSFARPSKPNVSPENLNDVVDNIARILETQAKEKGVAIAREFGDDLPKVWIDREQMKQVFMNLILNAIQAMQEGGSISISTRAVSRNSAEPSGEFVQVEVRDTGIGIPEENVQHIFDPFFTSKDEGSGLGLAVSHQIVQEHGGFVTVESTVGKGTAFFVHVPVGKPVRPAAANGRAQVNEANLNH